MMSPAQRREIIRLREEHDGATPGSYEGDRLPDWTKVEAMREIERLRAKIASRKPVKKWPCPLCGRDSCEHRRARPGAKT